MKFEDKTKLIDIAWRYIHLIDDIIDGNTVGKNKQYWIEIKNGILRSIIDVCKNDIQVIDKTKRQKKIKQSRWKTPVQKGK